VAKGPAWPILARPPMAHQKWEGSGWPATSKQVDIATHPTSGRAGPHFF